ncbi:DNA-directed RNA polymerase, partial [Dispira parvispora]
IRMRFPILCLPRNGLPNHQGMVVGMTTRSTVSALHHHAKSYTRLLVTGSNLSRTKPHGCSQAYFGVEYPFSRIGGRFLHSTPLTDAPALSPTVRRLAVSATQQVEDPVEHDTQFTLAVPDPPAYPAVDLQSEKRDFLILPHETDEQLLFPGNHTLENQLALVQACLVSGDFSRAKRMIAGLYRLHAREMTHMVDIGVHNTLLNGLMEYRPRPQTVVALEWFESLRTYKLVPTIDTYAIMIKGFLRVDSSRVVNALLHDLKKRALDPINLLQSEYLKAEDLERIVPLLAEATVTGKSASDRTSAMAQFVAQHEKLTKRAVVPRDGTSTTGPRASSEETPDLPAADAVMSKDTLGVLLLKKALGPLEQERFNLYDKQIRMEQESLDATVTLIQKHREARRDPFANMSVRSLKRYIIAWHKKMMELIEKELFLVNRSGGEGEAGRDRMYYGPFLKSIAPSKVAMATILSVLESYALKSGKNSQSTHISITSTVVNIANRLEDEYNSEQFKNKNNAALIPKYMDLNNMQSSGKLFNMAVRKALAKIEREQVDTTWAPKWPETSKVKLGSLLLSFLLDSAKLKSNRVDPHSGEVSDREVAAFHHSYVYEMGKKIGILQFSEEILEILSRETPKDTFSPRNLPMIVPPRPWLTFNSGGYLTIRSMSVRLKSFVDEFRYLKKASDEERLDTIHMGLDILGSTAWSVNRPVFDVVLEVWNSGKALGDIPAAKVNMELPKRPADYDTNPKARLRYSQRRTEVLNAIQNNHSLRCSANYQLEIARAFLPYTFYFPHNLDFRGRAYPIPPHFNHLGNDLCRGLLQFDKGKPLGPHGLRWLRIQLANLYGFDKHSFDDREQFAIDHFEDVKDSALHPLKGRRWWLNAEDPWQCLATCMDLHAASMLPDPTQYISHLPIHQDGTCNGLQHYAALGCDRQGAEHVNLYPSSTPQDVYSGVLHLVVKAIDRDAAADNVLAKLVQGKVTRKVIKQTVMTNVYGVTFVGAREQIYRRLKEVEDLDPDMLFKCSSYVAKLVFDSLGEIFSCARQIQDWLNEAASTIARSVDLEYINVQSQTSSTSGRRASPTTTRGTTRGGAIKSTTKMVQEARKHMNSVIWTTPLNLTVVQPYRNVNTRVIKTNLQSIHIADNSQKAPVNSRKQRTAFPPNFIHSLDASHMMLSAIECHRQDLVFSAVHDSYWTHACDVDTMNTILRNQFIKLHQQPILENLRDEFLMRYGNHCTPMYVDLNTGEAIRKANWTSTTAAVASSAASTSDATQSTTASTPGSPDTPSDVEASPGETTLAKEVSADDLDAYLADALAPKKVKKQRGRKKTAELRFVPLTLPPLPPKGDFKIDEVATSDYFFH